MAATSSAEAQLSRRMRAADQLVAAARALDAGSMEEARMFLRSLAPAPTTPLLFPLVHQTSPQERATRKVPGLPPAARLPVLLRDGFLDRYSPQRWRLVHPGALRVLSLLLPESLPTVLSSHNVPARYADNAPVWFDLWPTVDHVVPRCGSGTNAERNLICVSWWRNDAKRGLPFAATGWQVQPAGSLDEWDGLMSWFTARVRADPTLLGDRMVRNWHLRV